MDTENKKRILLFTGDGKGKTAAALGMALRAAGHGMKSIIVQFLKSVKHGYQQNIQAQRGVEY